LIYQGKCVFGAVLTAADFVLIENISKRHLKGNIVELSIITMILTYICICFEINTYYFRWISWIFMRCITLRELSIYQYGMKEKVENKVVFRFYFHYICYWFVHIYNNSYDNLHNDRTLETSCQHIFVEIHMHYFWSNDVLYLHVVTSFPYLSQTHCT